VAAQVEAILVLQVCLEVVVEAVLVMLEQVALEHRDKVSLVVTDGQAEVLVVLVVVLLLLEVLQLAHQMVEMVVQAHQVQFLVLL
jgi:hypothetical protein